jgi:hypothetical protein
MGFNHNVRHLGRTYHVQTEDSGVKNPHLFTHVFFGGTILATKKVVYDSGADEVMVRALMQKQHKDMLKDFKAGTYDDKLRAFFTSRNEPAELLGEGPLESEPEEVNPQGGRAVQQAVAAASQWDQMAAKAASEKPADAVDPFAGDDAPVITLGAPPSAARAPSRASTPAARAPAPFPSDDGEGPVITLSAPQPAQRAPSRQSTPMAPAARHLTPSPPPAEEEDGPVITLGAPPPRPHADPAPVRAQHAEPNTPKAGPSTMQRRIWAKKGGASERPFDDSGVFNAVAPTVPTRQQSGELPRRGNATGTAEIVDLPPNATPPPMVSPLRQPPQKPASASPMARGGPPPEEDGPVVVLAPPRSSSSQRPVAEPTAPQARSPRTSGVTPRVQIAAPSADGVVIARPPSVVVSGSVQSGTPARPVPPVHPTPHPAHPTAPRGTGTQNPVAAAGGKQPTRPPAAARETPADSIFGEDLISEKSLDEVILAYLAEDSKHPK